jgi:hypothetical protein
MLVRSNMLLDAVVQFVVLEGSHAQVAVYLQKSRHRVEDDLPVTFQLHTFDIGVSRDRTLTATSAAMAHMAKLLQALGSTLGHDVEVLVS